MAKGTRICKVCGAEYPYCKTNRPTGTFRWQDVACSPEHGSIYLSKINASRSKKAQGVAPAVAVSQTMNKKETPVKEETTAKEEAAAEEEVVSKEEVAAEEEAAVENVTDVVEDSADNTIWVADEATDRFKTWTTSAVYHPTDGSEEEEDSDDEDDVNEEDDDSWIDDDDDENE